MSEKVMTPEEFKNQILALQDMYESPGIFYEEADNLMSALLESLGYGEGIKLKFSIMERNEMRDEVLKFIGDFAGYDKLPEYNWEVIRKKFRAGYCYYFAHMLRNAFERGEVCWAAPFSHVVWVDTDGTPYDIEGEYKGEAFYFIPEGTIELSYELGLTKTSMAEFKHIGHEYHSTKEDLINLMKSYCKGNGIEYDKRAEKYLKG